MILLAAVAAAVAAFLIVAEATGVGLRRSPRPPRPRTRPTRKEWLAQAGAPVTPIQFWAASLAGGLFAGGLVLLVTGTLVVAALPAGLVAAIPVTYWASQRRTRAAQRVAAWPDALRALVSALEANQSLHQGLVGLAVTGPEPLRPVLARYAAMASTLDQRSAVELIRTELADPVSDSVVEVLATATTTGPAVAIPVLRDLAGDVAEDLQTLDRIQTLSLEQRLSAKAVFIIPYGVLVMLCLRAGAFQDFYRSRAGVTVALFGLALSGAGLLIVNRLNRSPATERLFTGGSGQ